MNIVSLSIFSRSLRLARAKATRLLATVPLVFLIAATSSISHGQTRKLAFVVGVSEYQKTGLTNLKYAHKDATDLSDELIKNGFEVTKFIGKSARVAVVRKAIKTFVEKTSDLNKDDIVLVSFSGHGVQKMVSQNDKLVEAPFICLYDSLVSKPETMISLNKVIEGLRDNSGCNSITSSAMLAYPAADEAYASLKAGEPEPADYLDHAKKYKGAVSEFAALKAALLADHESISSAASELSLDRFADNVKILEMTNNVRHPSQFHLEFLNKLKKATTNRKIFGHASLSEFEIMKKLKDINTDLELGILEQDEIPPKTKELLTSASNASRKKRMEGILNLLSKDYADVESINRYTQFKYADASTIGSAAESALFSLKNLSPGKMAPDIEGVDLQGKKFKLSDYRGKVIMLDFWGHW